MQDRSIQKRFSDAMGRKYFPWVALLSLVLWLISALTLVLVLTKGACAEACITKGATRTFLQLWRKDSQRDVAQWNQRFENLSNLGFTEVIVQWSSYGATSFYGDSTSGRESSPSLSPLIKAANRHKTRIWLGLHYDPDFWQAIAGKNRDVEAYFQTRLSEMESRWPSLRRMLNKADPKQEVVKGWYISDEIDDVNWQSPKRSNMLQTYLKSLRQKLSREKKSWPVLISGFSNGAMPPEKWSLFWERLLQKTDIDGFLFQDGIGAKKLALAELEPYLKFLADKMDGTDLTFSVIVEVFQLMESRDNAAIMRAANISRITKQLALARKYGVLPITLFSAPDYMIDQSDANNRKLFDAWRRDISACR